MTELGNVMYRDKVMNKNYDRNTTCNNMFGKELQLQGNSVTYVHVMFTSWTRS